MIQAGTQPSSLQTPTIYACCFTPPKIFQEYIYTLFVLKGGR